MKSPNDLTTLARSLAERPRAVTLFGAPEGHDAATIGALLKESGVAAWLHVCRDDSRMARFAAALQFFHPRLEVLTFPAWDCLPYDRVSPNGEIVSRRIDTLTRLAAKQPSPTMPEGLSGGDAAGRRDHPHPGPPPSRGREKMIVLTTVNALVQLVPPRNLFEGRVLELGKGGR